MPWLEWVKALAPAISALVATLAYFATRASSEAARTSAKAATANMRAAQGNVLGRLLSEYASPEMARALRRLDQFREELSSTQAHMQNEAFAMQVQVAIQKISTKEGLEAIIDSGRRLHWFVRQGDLLRRHKIIPDDLFRDAVAATNGYRLWAEVWLPFIKTRPTKGQPKDHLDWADETLKRFPPRSAAD